MLEIEANCQPVPDKIRSFALIIIFSYRSPLKSLKICALLSVSYVLIHSTETRMSSFSGGRSRGENVPRGNSDEDASKKKEQTPVNKIQ